jgi:hypothetical protein
MEPAGKGKFPNAPLPLIIKLLDVAAVILDTGAGFKLPPSVKVSAAPMFKLPDCKYRFPLMAVDVATSTPFELFMVTFTPTPVGCPVPINWVEVPTYSIKHPDVYVAVPSTLMAPRAAGVPVTIAPVAFVEANLKRAPD